MISYKRLIILFISISCFTISNFPSYAYPVPTTINVQDEDKVHYEPKKPPERSLEELYQDVFMTMLLPYINKAVDNYYEKNTGYSPSVDPWWINILNIERPYGYRSFTFIMKLKVNPYLGAHNSIGVDHITIKISYDKVEILKYEHIKDYPIPPWLQRKNNRLYKGVFNFNNSKTIEIFDISKESVIKKVLTDKFVQKEAENCLKAITNIYPRYNPIPDNGIIIKIPLKPAVEVKNDWIDDKVDELNIIYSKENEPILMVFENNKTPVFFEFQYDTIRLLKKLNLIQGQTGLIILSNTFSKEGNLNQNVVTKTYSLQVPSKWKVKTDGIQAEFFIGDKKVGEVARYGYLSYGNHYEVLYEKHLQGFSTDVLMVKLARSLPAAANDDTITEELHFYLPSIISTEKLKYGYKEVYDISFFTEFVQEDTALEIIKTFKYK
jgi:hypothetical protein